MSATGEMLKVLKVFNTVLKTYFELWQSGNENLKSFFFGVLK